MNPLATHVLAIVIAGAVAAVGAWRVQEWRWTSNVNAEKLAQSEANRNREKALATANQGVDRALQDEKKRRAAAERLAADSLRDLEAALAGSDDSTATGGTDDPRSAIIGECAAALEKVDRRAGELESTAKALQRYASEVCVAP